MRLQPCKRCAASAQGKRSYHLPLVVSNPHSKSVSPSGRHPAGQPFSRQYAGRPKRATIALTPGSRSIAWRRVCDRRAESALIDARFAQCPRQQRLRKDRVLWPARLDFPELRARFIGTSISDRIIEQAKLADKV